LLERIRKRVEGVINTLAMGAVRLHLSPAFIGSLGLTFSCLASILFFLSPGDAFMVNLAAVLVLTSGLCDALDGAVARATGKVSKFGGFMDSTLDRYSDAFIFLGIIAGKLVDLGWGFTALTGALLVSYVRAKAESLGVPLSGVGIAERAERLLIIAFSSFLSIVSYGVILIALLTHFTVIQRAAYVYSRLSSGRAVSVT